MKVTWRNWGHACNGGLRKLRFCQVSLHLVDNSTIAYLNFRGRAVGRAKQQTQTDEHPKPRNPIPGTRSWKFLHTCVHTYIHAYTQNYIHTSHISMSVHGAYIRYSLFTVFRMNCLVGAHGRVACTLLQHCPLLHAQVLGGLAWQRLLFYGHRHRTCWNKQRFFERSELVLGWAR